MSASLRTVSARAAAVVVTAMAAMCLMFGSGAALAAPPSYPIVDVQAGAAARYTPSVSNSWAGWVLDDGNGRQRSLVRCYADGDWATGNYRTNRWFSVFVYDSSRGYRAPRWLFVHASYVYNQKIVPRC